MRLDAHLALRRLRADWQAKYGHPVYLVCRLILFLTFVLTTIFFTRNLKPALREGRTRLHLAHLLYDDLVRGGLESFWAPP